MIISMTGYCREVLEYNNKKISIDIKSLNSKTSDINTRIPGYYKEKELEIRKLLSQKLKRGKMDFCMFVELNCVESSNQINEDVVVNYYNQVKSISNNNNIPLGNDLLTGLLKMPDVMKNNTDELSDEEWAVVLETINKAVDSCINFSEVEGKGLEKDIISNIKSILNLLSQVPEFEQDRINRIRERLKSGIKELETNNNSNENRFEQEIIYYLEKLDINEEKVRLEKHCDYFLETIKSEEQVGKKLGFISQEIGREINTLGSKANHAEMQKLVVMMKEELEKVKEQLLNVL
ncbi:MAG: YicC family protein [Marinilabiliales bacterium]|nr:MAG: YicC family protein [Marinilabiliales bacterium]